MTKTIHLKFESYKFLIIYKFFIILSNNFAKLFTILYKLSKVLKMYVFVIWTYNKD